MAVLRADQALAPDFFLRALPALEVADVRLAQGRLAYAPDLPPAADVFDVVRFVVHTALNKCDRTCALHEQTYCDCSNAAANRTQRNERTVAVHGVCARVDVPTTAVTDLGPHFALHVRKSEDRVSAVPDAASAA